MGWMKKCRGRNITLSGVGGEPLISEEEEQRGGWTDIAEEDSDSDDPTYKYDCPFYDNNSEADWTQLSDRSEFSINSDGAVGAFESTLEVGRVGKE